MYRTLASVIIFILLSFTMSYAQSYANKKTIDKKTSKIFEKAISLSRSGDFPKALEQLSKALEREPNFIDAYIQQGSIWYDQKQLSKAEKAFEKALQLDPTYEKLIYYQLGLTELKLEKYQESIEHFTSYLDSSPKRKYLIERTEKHLANARFLAENAKRVVPFKPQNLGDSINTEAAEYLPSFTADGAYLIYTTQRNNNEDFYFSKKVNGQWEKGRPLVSVNTPFNEGAQSISADGRLLVFTACQRKDGFGSCDLYYSEKIASDWSRPKNIGTPINTKEWESQPSLSADGKKLFYTSRRPGGVGGSDIWMSIRRADGSWEKPINLGTTINTPGKDEAPFIHPDGRTLYFMSNGHAGFGGFDLYFSRLEENNTWAAPKNLGSPINSDANEGALVVSLDGSTAYFASDKSDLTGEEKGKSRGKVDIYSFPLYEEARPLPVTYVKAVVKDASNGNPLQALVEFVDLSSEMPFASSFTDEEGAFLVCLPLGKNYSLNVSKEEYLFHSDHFALSETTSLEEPYLLEIELETLPKETEEIPSSLDTKPIVLKNIFFETGSAVLLKISLIELNRLKTLLEDYPKLEIQINGHTDDIGSEEDNQALSEARAKAVYNFLIEQGIKKERLGYKGFGESKPIAGNDTAEGRQQNRRTEFQILK